VEALAASVSDNGGVNLVPAFVGLGAPHWDAYARGTILGLTRGSTSAHIARAALEGIAFQVADLLTAMESDSSIKLAELRVDGGACANNLLMQTQADLLGVPVVRAANPETTAMGAAYLAGLAVGFYKSTDEISSQWASDRTFEPKISSDERQKLRAGWSKALERSKAYADDGRPSASRAIPDTPRVGRGRAGIGDDYATDPTDTRLVQLFYATNRGSETDADVDTDLKRFSAKRSLDLTFGSAVVRVPESHRLGAE
jgi:glycerol kinase